VGIYHNVTCLDCRTHAPDWGGYFGAPSLSTEPVPTGRYLVLPFGYLYQPFLGLGIRPYELEKLRAFLIGHEGHSLCQWSDADSELPPELTAILESPEEQARDTVAEVDREARERAAALANGTYLFGRYTVTCSACRAAFRSQEPDCLMARPRGPVSSEAIAVYLGFAPAFDPEDHSRTPFHVDSVGGFVQALEKFLRTHETHRVDAWVEPEAA
jgi:hypothetical protein